MYSKHRLIGNHSTYIGRYLLALVTFFALLLLTTPTVSAAPLNQKDDGGGSTAIALDALCVDGLVINHQEQPLPGWTVTATYVGTQGTATPQTDVSNANGRFSFNLDLPGRWLFTLALPSDWVAVTDTSFEVDLAYGHTDCVQIRFKVQQQITITVIKIDDDHRPLAGWTIIATPGPNNPFNEVHTAVTNEEGIATFTLPPGDWVFSEQAPDGVTWWRPIMPPDGVQELTVVAPGPYTIRFKNDVKVPKNGCIVVTKQDVPPVDEKGATVGVPFGLPDWPVEVLRADGSVAAQGLTDAFGQITFSGLPFGPYVVREIVLDGWEPVTPTAYGVVLSSSDDACTEIVFQNKQTEKGLCIEGIKLDAKDGVGIPGWEITAVPLDAGGYEPEPVVTDGLGHYRFDFPLEDYRIPGGRFEVCEESRDGWTPVNDTCHVVTVPKYPGKCAVVPPFVNRQTNEQHEQPQGHQPKHDKQPAHDNNPKWEPQHPNAGTCSVHHTVNRGESVSSIASKYGRSTAQLMNANPWVRGQHKHWLYVGQQVCIP